MTYGDQVETLLKGLHLRLMEEEPADVAAWLDKSLIKLASRFGSFTSGQPHTLQLPPSFSMLPQWFFNLRRSPFMQASHFTLRTPQNTTH